MAKSGMGLGGRLLIGVVAIGATAGAAVLGASAYVAHSNMAAELAGVLSDKLGRQVTLKGVKLTLWPVLGVEAGEPAIANIPGGRAAHLVEAQSVSVGVAPMPLLSGRIEVRDIVLQSPTVDLEKLADGRVNWTLTPKSTGPAKPTPSWLKDLRIDRLLISGGKLSYFDGASGRTETLSELNLSLALQGLDQPLAGKGDFAFGGEPAKFEFGVASPRALMAGKSTGFNLSLASKPVTLSVGGHIAPDPDGLSGDIDVRGPSLRELAALAGSKMTPGPGLSAFSAKGHVVRKGQVIAITGARIGLDHLGASGNVTLDLSGARPKVSGDVATADLDMNPYLGPEPPPGAAWPRQPIRLDALKAFDADLRVRADKVAFRKYRATAVRLAAKVAEGQADVTIAQMALYGGTGAGRVTATPLANGGRFAFLFKLTGVEAKTLLSDAFKVDKLEGQAAADINLVTSGGDQNALMHALAGKASLNVTNGAVLGVDLAAVSKRPATAITGGSVGPNAKTPFSVAGADFTLAGGVASTKDVSLTGPGVSVGGVGAIDIGEQSLDMAIKPQAAGKALGKAYSLGGVPIRIHGPWAKLSYEPDLSGAAAAALLGQIGKSGGSDGLAGLLGGLTGDKAPAKTPTSSDPSTPKKKSDKLSDILGGLVPR